MKSIYLDYAAATPMDQSVQEVMQPYFSDAFYNPSATYLKAKSIAHDISDARQSVAKILGVRPSEIIYTAGGSEANNLAICGVMDKYPGSHMICSAVEHESVIKPSQKYNNSILPVQSDGRVDLLKLRDLIRDDTVLVSIMYVNNEIGTIMPLRKISKILEEKKAIRLANGNDIPLYLHTDACQAPLYLDIHCDRLGVDMMTLNSGKMYGPKQTGALYIKTGTEVEPLIRGGGQEHGMRSGTENVSGVIGFSIALQNAVRNQSEAAPSLLLLQKMFIDGIKNISNNCEINGSRKYRVPNNVHITFPGVDNERLMMELDEAGIMCAVGSACSASNDEPSHVLKAIGLTDEQAQSSLRFTMGKYTTKDDVSYTLKTLIKLIKQ